MPDVQPSPQGRSRSARSNCPDCDAHLVILKVIGGRGECEYWTLRCTRCGGIHLDIIDPAPEAAGTSRENA
jgi:uncharacterized Zn finger protein